jgi:hypothetical protein
VASPSCSDPAGLAAAWDDLAEGLRRVGRELVAHASDPADAADGMVHLSQLVQLALRWHIDANDPDFPRFVHLNDTFELADNRFAAVRSDAEYVLSGHVASLFDVNISLHEGWGFLGQARVWGDLGLDDLDVADDGSFTLVLGGAPSGPRRLEIPPEATIIQVREYYEDWSTHEPGRFEITRVGSEADAPPRRDPADVARRLSGVLPWIEGYLHAHGGMVERLRAGIPANSISPPGNQLGGNKNIQYGFGRFDLAPDQAMVIEFARPEARLWSVQWLTDPWYENPDLANRATSLSGRDAHVGDDGVVRVVVSAADPRVPNWLDVGGYVRGVLMMRWIWCTAGSDITTSVVDLEKVRDALPDDTPTVSPEQRRAEQARRRSHFAGRRR